MKKKIRAINLYLRGLSYRQVGRILEVSRTRVWEAVQKLAEAIYQPKILAVRKQRSFIAVDDLVVWITVDVTEWLREVMLKLS